MNLCHLEEMKGLLARHGFRTAKALGQNFLIENWVPQEIGAAAGVDSSHGVLEIGPGIGPLTQVLATLAHRVVAVELDRRLLPILGETMAPYHNVEIVSGDILKLSIPKLVEEKLSGDVPMVCANLPYQITSPVITALIQAKCFASITVMVQREVAQRICAQPGGREYGSFSVFCQVYTQPQILFDVPPDCFYPAPKVTSSVLQMIPQQPPFQEEEEGNFFRVVRAAFCQRRKTLINSLFSGLRGVYAREALLEAVTSCGFSSEVRGEKLSILEFYQLSKKISELSV